MKNEKTKQWLQMTFVFFFLSVVFVGVISMSFFVMTHYGNELGIIALLVMLLIIAAFVASLFE